jgi:hypothetical protein
MERRTTMEDMITRPQWLDEKLYPFQSRFVEIEGNRIHDEGHGPTLLLLHGTHMVFPVPPHHPAAVAPVPMRGG